MVQSPITTYGCGDSLEYVLRSSMLFVLTKKRLGGVVPHVEGNGNVEAPEGSCDAERIVRLPNRRDDGAANATTGGMGAWFSRR